MPDGALRALKERRPERLLPILICPRCRSDRLTLDGEVIPCARCSATYPVLDGVPVLFPAPTEVRIMPLDHESNAPPEDLRSWLAELDGLALNVGAGAADVGLPEVIELEYSIFRGTDVAADAHHLPFADGTFAAVVSFNTWEHLADPARAAAEVHRVLRPGGRLRIQTAFLQPVHEAPHHFYNTTEYGLLRWFEDFEIERCTVPGNFNPVFAISWLCSELLGEVAFHLGPEAERQLATASFRDLALMWSDVSRQYGPLWEMVESLPEVSRKRLAAGFEIEAVKRA